MNSDNLTTEQAELLLALPKFYRGDEKTFDLPTRGKSLRIPLESEDAQERFSLDISTGRIELKRFKVQTRARKTVILRRLDLYGRPHVNPDGEEIPCPHLHKYREGFGDRWAECLPAHLLTSGAPLKEKVLKLFMAECNIDGALEIIQKELF